MAAGLERRLAAVLSGTALAPRLPGLAASFLERRSGDAAAAAISGPALAGLARLLASNAEAARFLALRPALLSRLAGVGPGSLAARAAELEAQADSADVLDLEAFLDALRLLRRDETLFAACVDLGGLGVFPEVSRFLSVVAEATVRKALGAARRAGLPAAAPLPGEDLAVLGMGKVGGREFTYYSDLDLILLCSGGTRRIEETTRLGQRLITYLTTMTGAGIAYPVDARLRPSGSQGMLVTSFESFESYQRHHAELWEHLALTRARAIAGCVALAQELLQRVLADLAEEPASLWAYVADMRRRVERERGSEAGGKIPIKTGAGGIMDVEFLAAGGLLERGSRRGQRSIPSVDAALVEVLGVRAGEALRAHYRFLRVVEARARWVAGRGVEVLNTDEDTLGAVAELVEPHLTGAGLLERVSASCREIRSAYQTVVDGKTIRALAG